MLNNDKIQALAKIGQMKVICCDGIPISVSAAPDIEIKYPYEQFIKEMGLEDLRLSWLLGTNNMIAGGSVLNWIWGENTHEDIDFFFKDEEYADIFVEFIKGIEFKLVSESGYAATYFESSQGVILQVVRNTDKDDIPQLMIAARPSSSMRFPFNSEKIQTSNFIAYGTPQEIIKNFDLHVCKFAVDADYLYTTPRAIQDLLKLTISNTGNEKRYFLPRILKYVRKGFFPSPKMKRNLKYEKPAIQDGDNSDWF